MCHISGVTCRVSGVRCQFIYFLGVWGGGDKVIEQVGGGFFFYQQTYLVQYIRYLSISFFVFKFLMKHRGNMILDLIFHWKLS